MALPRHNRLRASRDFSRVYRKGKRAATPNLAMRALKLTSKSVISKLPTADKTKSDKRKSKRVDEVSSAPLLRAATSESAAKPGKVNGPCFGISISRKVSKRAVVRNRIKRQLKAIIHQQFLSIDPQWQLVIVVRPPAVECSFDDFLRELEYLLQKLAIR
ncbi:MAG: ribonuclease P protein component [Cyanobacteria bacterium J06560_6]